MKPNFEAMSTAELKIYVLSHRDDDEAIRTLFSRRNPPDSEATWYGPMCTPDGLPIEENIQIAEEAIRKRSERDHEKQRQKEQERVNSGKNDMTVVTQEEIENFRKQLRDYPEAIAALDEIEACEGHLEDAAVVLAIEAGQEPERGAREWLEGISERCRPILCQEDFRDEIMAGLLAGSVEALLATTLIPSGLATPVVIYAFKIGIRKFCNVS
ncbi:MAG: hypothetical protein RID53_18845 [Coleofasciculus sp. B1-GNL1-01]|uniref:DUF6887 family protein n=1 Tax=Coleofasciculus sp. B1-GNL1-01 TaxID=3068484 RepID=UPI0032FA9D17